MATNWQEIEFFSDFFRVVSCSDEGTIEKFRLSLMHYEKRFYPIPEPERIFDHSNNDTLESILSKGEVQTGFFILKPVKKDGNWLPLLALSWIVPDGNFQPYFQIRVALHNSESTEENAREQTPFGFAFRFETSHLSSASLSEEEEQTSDAQHDYFHIQPIKSFGNKGPVMGGFDWVPESFPAFPIPAQTRPDVFLSLALSLYGNRKVREKLLEAKLTTEKKKKIAKRLDNLLKRARHA